MSLDPESSPDEEIEVGAVGNFTISAASIVISAASYTMAIKSGELFWLPLGLGGQFVAIDSWDRAWQALDKKKQNLETP